MKHHSCGHESKVCCGGERGTREGLWTFSWERLRSSCCLVGLLKPAALLMAPRIALGEVTFRLLLLLFLAAPSNLGFPKPVMRLLLLLLEAALALCALAELTLWLLLPPKPCIRLCTRGSRLDTLTGCRC